MPELPLDDTSQLILALAIQEAYRLNHHSVGSAHLFLAFTREPEGALCKPLSELGFSAEGLRLLVRQALVPGRPGSVFSPEEISGNYTESVRHALQVSRQVAERDGAAVVGERHLLVAFLTSGLGSIFNLLNQVGLDPAVLLAAVEGRSPIVPSPDQAVAGRSEGVFGPDGQIDLSLFDAGAQEVLAGTALEAAFARADVGTPHFIIALLGFPDGYLPAWVSRQGLDPALLADALRQSQNYERPAVPPPPQPLLARTCSTRLRRIWRIAGQLARQDTSLLIGERTLLAALLRDGGGSSATMLERHGLNWSEVGAALQQAGATPPRATSTPLLDKLGRDLTEAARQGKLSPIIGRKRELEQIVLILSKDTKNNPLLVGEAGVGKTAVVEALAQHIAEGKVPANLRDKRLVEITMTSLVAGTRYRGDFEERLQRLINEVRENADVLIFVDEIHTMVGAGDAGGNLDAANILKPALARGELRCLGATTSAEYQRTIAQDSALARRFQQVMIEELSPEETLHILQATRARYEVRYGVQLALEALTAAVRLSVQYLPDLRLPDKARDLIEEACARASVGTMGQWGAATGEREAAGLPAVDAAAIAQIVAERKHLPLDRLTADEQQRLLGIEERLKARVVGQDEAVAAVARAVRLARAGLKAPDRPSGVFLFIGPTGVGKTELAKALAAELFGADDALSRLDMSEFMEPHSVSKLIGAPPGYVGYREEGQLVRDLRRKPYSVVLIDEIEKAASNIFDLFLQLFDEGRLTDAQGQAVDGRHAIYILTSNVGTELVGRRALGFGAAQAGEENFLQAVRDRLRQTFRPEFLNRIDEIIVFHRLEPEHIHAIALLQVQTLQARVETEHGVRLEVTPEAVDLLAAAGYSETLGARPLQRAITRLLAAPLGDLLLTGAGGTITARVEDGRLVLETG